jgi:3-phosphoshikimate 1-carboxyvinyltransferase
MNAIFSPCRLQGTIPAPPSKSYAHRMLICAALAQGESRIFGIEESQDILATLDCIRALGASAQSQNDAYCVRGADAKAAQSALYPCHESGSTLRFFLPIALLCGKRVRFSGSERLLQRGISLYKEVLSQKGITFSEKDGAIEARGRLTSGEYTLRGNVSSQFLSGLLFALPLCDGDSVLRVLPPFESRAYVDLTLDAMAQFGVTVEREGDLFRIRGNQSYTSRDVQVEGDWSNAAFLYALQCCGHEIEVTNLNDASLQGDRVCYDYLLRLQAGFAELDVANCPDLAPILFAMAAAQNGAHFYGTSRLSLKESDRANAMAQELAKFGAKITVNENDVFIEAARLHTPTQVLCGHNDHRIVMALCVLATRYGGEITDAQAVAKSYPSFFQVIARAGAEVSLCN